MRTERDCQLLFAMVSAEITQTEVNLLMGLLLAEYAHHPQSAFWDIVEQFVAKKTHSRFSLEGA